MAYSDGSLRALTLVDIISQLQQDSGQEIAYNPDEVINQLTADAETLKLTGETLSTSTVTNYPVNLIQDVGPVGYWRLDDPTGATTAYDSSPWATATYPKVPGTVNGTVTFGTSGAMPGSTGATFDGSTGYILVNNTSSLQRVGDLTVELWVKPASLAAAQALVSKGAGGEYHVVLNTNGSVSFQFGTYNTVVVPASTIAVGSWYHLVITRRAVDKTIKAYVNGTSRYSGTYTTAPTASSSGVRIGASSPSPPAQFFSGALDEVAIYARPLTAAQVSSHYQWAQDSHCGSTPYNTVKYGYGNYPNPGPPAGAVYGDASTTYGAATYA